MGSLRYSSAMSSQREGGYSRISAQKYSSGSSGFGGGMMGGGSAMNFRQGSGSFGMGGGAAGGYAQSVGSSFAMNSAGASMAGGGFGRSGVSFGSGGNTGFGSGQAVGFGGGQGAGYAVNQGGGFGGGYAGGFRSGQVTSFSGGQGGGFGTVQGDSFGVGYRPALTGGVGYYGGPGGSFPTDFVGPDPLFPGNEKQTMQNLNDRLSSYLEKVRALETANADLEVKIREWYANQISAGTINAETDHNNYFDTITDLRNKIQGPSIENARIVLQVDNARLAADDFRMKYENELYFRQSVEADINGLKRVLEEQNLARTDLEVQIDTMTEELTFLKTNHEEELQTLHGQAAGQVNVEIDAVPGVALTKRLKDMRADYEALTERNRMEAEQWFIQKSLELKREITVGVEEVQTTTTEVSEQRRLAQTVETEMQSQLAMRKSIEDTLTETENRYSVQLMQIQLTISTTEDQLSQVRNDMDRQKTEYQQLLDIKIRLEKEIETYRRLLEEEGGSLSLELNDESAADDAYAIAVSEVVSESSSRYAAGSVHARGAAMEASGSSAFGAGTSSQASAQARFAAGGPASQSRASGSAADTKKGGRSFR